MALFLWPIPSFNAEAFEHGTWEWAPVEILFAHRIIITMILNNQMELPLIAAASTEVPVEGYVIHSRTSITSN
jgi:hypothetical protein